MSCECKFDDFTICKECVLKINTDGIYELKLPYEPMDKTVKTITLKVVSD